LAVSSLLELSKYVPGAVGFIAPFVASIAAPISTDRKKTKVAFVLVGLLLGAASFAANVVSENTVSAQRQEIRSALGATISVGEKLIANWRTADEKQFEDDANAWATKADDFVLAAFGGGEEAMFRSDAGYVFYGDGSRRSNIRTWIDGRLRRLNDLVQRSTAIPIEKGFDTKTFR
jgi:hypothetical protein